MRQGVASVTCAVALALFVVGCATTKLTVVWMDETYQGYRLDNVLVMGVSDRTVMRRVFEDKFVKQLEAAGIRAVSSAAAIPGEHKLTKEAIEPELKELGIDAVLITHLVAVDKETVYVPPQTYSVPYTYHYYKHYYMVYDYVHTPGYYSTYKIVRLETNIFHTKTGKPIWSAQSETLDPRSAEKLMDSLINLVINDLKKKKLLQSPKRQVSRGFAVALTLK
jgi:hypothetical protein